MVAGVLFRTSHVCMGDAGGGEGHVAQSGPELSAGWEPKQGRVGDECMLLCKAYPRLSPQCEVWDGETRATESQLFVCPRKGGRHCACVYGGYASLEGTCVDQCVVLPPQS